MALRVRFSLINIFVCLLFGATAGAQSLRSGDLLFQAAGVSGFSEAISSATARGDSLSFVHVAVVLDDEEGGESVVEASPEAGVRIIALNEFLAGSPTIDGLPAVVVKRLPEGFPAAEGARRALDFIGQPYDWFYLPANGMLYCSELVYESFLYPDGTPFFPAAPMRFRADDGSMPEFWTELYNSLGVDVPEGIPGTNPNDMSRDARLREVFRYF